MSDEQASMVFLAELDSLSDAHFVGSALEEAGIAYRVAQNDSHAFDLAIPHGWGMVYVDGDRIDEARDLLESVRADEQIVERGGE
ncbi:MAG: hypothetical protein ACQEXJ_11015 [Myxococcota bacterium]